MERPPGHTLAILATWVGCLQMYVGFVSEKEGVVALHLLVWPLKIRSMLELLLGCEPSTYQLISR